MPIPSPHKGESQKKFVSRCISTIYDEYKGNPSQAQAICFRTWKDHKAKAAYVVKAGDDEYAFAKEPIDSDIEKRNKTASNPPKDAIPGLNPYGVSVNPDNSNAPSRDLPAPGSKNQEKKESADSMDQGKKPDINDMQFFLGGYTLEPVLDEHTGLAKWPLSFKRVEKDTKRPNKPANKAQDVSKDDRKPEQPPTAV